MFVSSKIFLFLFALLSTASGAAIRGAEQRELLEEKESEANFFGAKYSAMYKYQRRSCKTKWFKTTCGPWEDTDTPDNEWCASSVSDKILPDTLGKGYDLDGKVIDANDLAEFPFLIPFVLGGNYFHAEAKGLDRLVKISGTDQEISCKRRSEDSCNYKATLGIYYVFDSCSK